MPLRESRNIRNSVWNMANIGLYPVTFLALTPYFIESLGEHLFGSWMVLNSIVFISVQVLHFGMGPSIAVYVAESRGKKDPVRLNRYYNSALNFSTLLALGVLVAACLIWFLTPLEWFAWKGIKDLVDLKLATSLAIGVISTKFFEQLFAGFYKGFEEYDTAAKFNMAHKLSMVAGQFLCAYLGLGLSAFLLVSFVSNALLALAQLLWSKRYLIDYQWKARFDKTIFLRLRHFGFWSWLQTLIAMLGFQLDRIIVAFALGTDIVAYYSIASMIANHLHIALEALIGWVFPAVSRIVNSKGDPIPLFITVRSFLLSTALIGLAVLYLIRIPLFELWLGVEKATAVLPFLELFILLEVFYILSIAPKFFLNGISALKLVTTIEMSYKSLGIILMLVLFYFQRSAVSLIWGQVLALMVSMPIVMFVINKRVLKLNWLRESLFLVLPCFSLFLALMAPGLVVSSIFGLTAAGLIYFVYVKHPQFNLKLLLE